MDKSTNGEFSQTQAVHPRVLRVSGDEAHRWCAAIWSVSPGEQQLVSELRSLVESTLAAHWMQPPIEYEPTDEIVNSFDAVFYGPVESTLGETLYDDGWRQVELRTMVVDEYEQFEVFVEEAEDVGRSISSRPDDLWRCEVEPSSLPDELDAVEFHERVAEMLEDGVWGQTPGWFSRAYCRELGAKTDIEIAPNRAGLQSLEDAVVGPSAKEIHWLDPIDYQALCDFVGVVLEAESSLDVQWGTCPVDEETGLAPLPLLRARKRPGSWETLYVGRDVIRRICVPWGRRQAGGSQRLTALVDDYQQLVSTP